ncbi:MAG TPA: hypothetical protein VEJ63_23265 [Planctomycetota bacterium]|nr:hypothetical protein [Planctomycetota bacterium]
MDVRRWFRFHLSTLLVAVLCLCTLGIFLKANLELHESAVVDDGWLLWPIDKKRIMQYDADGVGSLDLGKLGQTRYRAFSEEQRYYGWPCCAKIIDGYFFFRGQHPDGTFNNVKGWFWPGIVTNSALALLAMLAVVVAFIIVARRWSPRVVRAQ